MLKENNKEVLLHVELPNKLARIFKKQSIGWLGQTTASLCWIASIMVTGIHSNGDWLQLCAASAWLIANIATISSTDN
ncbi:MAG: hypothetical protein AAF410_00885 [Pseudomonadota bacterium]